MSVALVFILIFRAGIISSGDLAVPYSVFVIFGVLLWQTFADAVNHSVAVVVHFSSLMRDHYIPPDSLLISVFLRVAVNGLFRLVVMLTAALVFDAYSVAGLGKFLLLSPLIILLGMALGAPLAPLNAVSPDIGRAVSIVLRPLMYASPVLWQFPRIPVVQFFNDLNPVGIVISSLRAVATQGTIGDPWRLGVTALGVIVVALLGCTFFRASVPVVIGRV